MKSRDPADGHDVRLVNPAKLLGGQPEQKKNSQRKTNVKIKIAEAYLNVLLKEFQRGIALADRQRYQQYYDQSAGKYKLGALLEAEYLTAELNWQNSQLTAQKAAYSFLVAILNYEKAQGK